MQAEQVIRFLTLLYPHKAIRWLLRDEFSDTRAAGAVNGTPATPGPGTRVVTDTESKMSIAGGVLAISGGKATPTDGDPGYWLDGLPRAAGRVLLFKVTYIGGLYGYIGLDNNQADKTLYGLQTVGPGLGFINNAIYGPSGLLNVASGIAYNAAIVLRSTGCYVFWKGGAWPNWILLWISAAGSDATIYPSIGNYERIFGVDWLRVPDALWLPTPSCADTFTRANGALGTSETAGPDSQAVAARTWVNRVGTTLVAINKASASALVGGIALATVDTGTLNVLVQAALTRSGNNVGIVLRYADTQNYIIAYHDGTNAKLDKVVDGATTSVISAAEAYSASANIMVVAEDTSFTLFYNNAKIGNTSTVSDAGLQTGTECGLYSTNTGNTQDNFLVFPRGSNGEYSRLDRWSG